MSHLDKINQKAFHDKNLHEINYKFYHITILLGFFSQKALNYRVDEMIRNTHAMHQLLNAIPTQVMQENPSQQESLLLTQQAWSQIMKH